MFMFIMGIMIGLLINIILRESTIKVEKVIEEEQVEVVEQVDVDHMPPKYYGYKPDTYTTIVMSRM